MNTQQLTGVTDIQEVTKAGAPLRQITLTFQLSEDLLADFLTVICETSPDTAMWATARRIKRNAEGYVTQIELAYDTQDDDEGQRSGRAILDFDSIKRGIEIALQPDTKISGQIRDWIHECIADGDACMFDADCADAVAQLAVFGELVYG